MTQHVTTDVAVFGAGTAGLNAAVQLARLGLHVALVEQRPMGKGGARWCNGVLDWQFERAGLAQPAVPELRPSDGATHMVAPDSRHRFTVTDSPTVEVDMRLLNERLLGEAQALGIRLFERARTPRAELSSGRLVAVEVVAADRGEEPRPVRFDAPLFVDASGRAAVLRRQSPVLDRWCPEVDDHQLCSASQFNYRITDPDGARRFLDQHGARPGDTVDWVGFAGGFSALVVHVDEALDEVGILTGMIASEHWGSGRSILQLMKGRLDWVGEPLFGGSGLIPLRRPYARFTAPGLALVGDAACQVFPAHGSGIGIGLIAGRMLAEAVERDGSIRADDDGDPGSEQTLWDYQSSFMREFGGTLGSYDALRRLSSALGTSGVLRMFRAGLFSEATAGAGLNQTWEPPDRSELAKRAVGLIRDPGLAVRMVPSLARAAVAQQVYDRYPTVADEGELRRWERAARVVLGPVG